MAKIIIKNLGPIKEAEFDLNKVNVFMGPQSSGKSMIAKVISMCQWVEKRRILDGFYHMDFYERLKEFHNLENTYFPDGASFEYDGEYCIIQFLDKKADIRVKEGLPFENRKYIYIPSERNFVSTIPNLGRYKENNNNILNFLYDWYEAKKRYPKENFLKVPILGIAYYHIEEKDKDVVALENGKELNLQNTSSGVQSMLPLYVLLDYLSNILYKSEIVLSPLEKEQLGKNKNIVPDYHFSQFIIEEPEQNLFPSTQRDLIYYLLAVLNRGTEEGRNHRLTFTTHSPYILYALNNCMMGHLVKNQLGGEEKTDYLNNKFLSEKSWIDPKLVSVWEIEDGKIRIIQDKDNIIAENYFDQKMTELTDEYYQMLNYYKNEE